MTSSQAVLCVTFCPGDNSSDWVKHWVKGGHNYYYNLKTKEGTWVEPEDFLQNSTQLNKEDIQVCLFLMFLLSVQVQPPDLLSPGRAWFLG